jgi:hypothetical protein
MTRIERAALVAYGVIWLLVPGFIAVVIRLQVPNPGELLRDVAEHRALWIGANALLIAQQALLTVAGPAIARRCDGVAADAVGGLLAIAGGALIASGVFHGVLGAHLASRVGPGSLDVDLVRRAELVHALGDTCWFVGIGALTAATAVTSAAWWRSTDARRHLARLGAVAVVVDVLQFGWFADHVFGAFAAPGTVLQAAWFVVLGVTAVSPHRPP